MQTAVSLWPLLGVLVIVIGFILRFNPMLVVVLSAVVTGLAAAMPVETILASIGNGFIKTRMLPLIILLPLAVIGMLERHGLREHAQNWISRIQTATAGRLLVLYLFVREMTAAVGLTSLGGHAQMVRPLLAPMAEGAVENRYGKLPDDLRHKLHAFCASTDNVGLFFGEDIFVAFGAIALMHTFLIGNGIDVEPIHIALWGIPTAICAFLIHAARIHRFNTRLERRLQSQSPAQMQPQSLAAIQE
ncbi:DUF969 domain-containing protein [Pseudomonas asiatica]|uniref:DUF969 domain-containing protein n=1 Tax=Pseudomonas asiatica TaxID=2219225 RepID=A0A9X4DDY9_9PSED|nr:MULTISPECIES: DUF969 domain-containing protein [Pseudomonas]MEE1902653.1 DUF969 domain-containing protein [Pseudomonas inefficax]AHD15916.1 membrane protein [Pseudomonas sp. FGI182]MDD2114782.1 DUF969 domain-containing protein [Pseudomonas asiatica]MEE1907446.1 DUF969 domain-containing protein [Pseudomonas inefficax]MEE1984910.1 DUF969 domain-containing protein [Pseudomonas inefficax]